MTVDVKDLGLVAEEESLDIYAEGICHMSVCAPNNWTNEKVEQVANEMKPTGIESKWAISSDTKFASGLSNPCVCEYNRERMHYLLEC